MLLLKYSTNYDKTLVNDVVLFHAFMFIASTPTLSYPAPFIPIACDCSCVGAGVGGASGGFIGGVLLTAAIAGCVAAAVFYRNKSKLNTKTM